MCITPIKNTYPDTSLTTDLRVSVDCFLKNLFFLLSKTMSHGSFKLQESLIIGTKSHLKLPEIYIRA